MAGRRRNRALSTTRRTTIDEPAIMPLIIIAMLLRGRRVSSPPPAWMDLLSRACHWEGIPDLARAIRCPDEAQDVRDWANGLTSGERLRLLGTLLESVSDEDVVIIPDIAGAA